MADGGGEGEAGGVGLGAGQRAALGVVRAAGGKLSAFPFAHGGEFALDGAITLLDSYHCSRYNTNTRVLTPDMFRAVFARARGIRDETPVKRR